MNYDNVMLMIQDFTGHQWIPLAILVVGWLTSMFSDVSNFPVNIPDRWKPVVVIVLGQAYAVLEAIQGGSAWKTAVTHGLVVSFTTMGLFDLLVKAVFNGNIPSWLQVVSLFNPKLVSLKAEGKGFIRPLVGFWHSPSETKKAE